MDAMLNSCMADQRMKAFTCTPLYPLERPRALALWSSPTHARRHDSSSQRCSKHRKQPKEPRDDLFSRNDQVQDACAPLTHDSQHMSRWISSVAQTYGVVGVYVQSSSNHCRFIHSLTKLRRTRTVRVVRRQTKTQTRFHISSDFGSTKLET